VRTGPSGRFCEIQPAFNRVKPAGRVENLPYSAASGISSGSGRTGAFASPAPPLTEIGIRARWRQTCAVGNGIEIEGLPFGEMHRASIVDTVRLADGQPCSRGSKRATGLPTGRRLAKP
jgi:hypothetical protein